VVDYGRLDSGATFRDNRRYRYDLWRRWGPGTYICFVGLNPSTADETQNDPTVERCERRAHTMGYGGLRVVNIFARRSTDPKELYWPSEDPVGPENDAYILRNARESSRVVCAWGTHGAHLGRGAAIEKMLRDAGVELYCLGLTKEGHPKHPLYIPYRTELRPWR